MLTWLRWLLIPDLLTSRLAALSDDQRHRVARRMGIFEGMHDFLEGFCGCELFPDLGEEDLDDLAA